MKILIQERNMLVDTTNADIYLDTDGVWHYVKLMKGKREYVLGGYTEECKAKTELSRIFEYIRTKKDTYCMSEK